MKTASKLLIASTTSVLLATAAASSGSGAVQTVTTKAHPGHSAHGVTPKDPQAKKFVKGVSVPEITEHQIALQRIASLNDDTREVFSQRLPGVARLRRADAARLRLPTRRSTQFNFPFWAETQPPVLNMVAPTPKTYVPGDAEDNDQPTADFITMANSPTVELTNAPVFPVGGIVDPPTGGSASGCAAADYAGVSGKVALVQRGTCAVRRQVGARAGRGRHGRDHLQRGQHPRAAEPDLRRQPARPAGDDRRGDHQLHARQRAAAGLQAGPEPDGRLQGLRRLHRPLPAAGDRRDAGRRPEPRRRGRRAPRLRACGPGHQRRRLRHGDAARPGPGSSPTATTTCATRSASCGGAPRRTGWSARPTTPTTSARRKSTRST